MRLLKNYRVQFFDKQETNINILKKESRLLCIRKCIV